MKKQMVLRISLLTAIASVAVLAAAVTAQAATLTVGPKLEENLLGALPCGNDDPEGCALAATEISEATAVAPVAGTITSWRLGDPSAVAGYELVVAHPNSNGTYAATGSTGPVTPAEEEVVTMSTHLSVAAGDVLELRAPAGSGIGVVPGASHLISWSPPLKTGETRAPLENGKEEEAPFSAAYNATVEYTTMAPPVPAPLVIPPAASPMIPAAHCTVPKLTGKKLKAAKKAVRGAGCKVGLVATQAGAKAATAKVSKQAPKAASVVAAGTVVSLQLG